MSIGRLLLFLVITVTVCGVVYMCIQVSQQVQIIIYEPHAVTGLVINCRTQTGQTYPCLLCVPLNYTILKEKPRHATSSCTLNVTYVKYFTYANTIDHAINLTIELPWRGLRQIVETGGEGTATVYDIYMPAIGLETAEEAEYKTGEYTYVKGVKTVPLIIVPSEYPKIDFTKHGNDITISTNLNYILLLPLKHVKFSKVMFGGYETVELNDFGFIVLTFSRYFTNAMDKVFRDLGKTIGLSQAYRIVFPRSVMVFEEDTYRLNITISYTSGNETHTTYMTYTVTYGYSRCLTPICYVAYITYLTYPNLYHTKMPNGTAIMKIDTVIARGKPMNIISLMGKGESIHSSTPTLIVVNITHPLDSTLLHMAYLNISKIPRTGTSMTQLFYIPTSKYVLHLHEVGTATVNVDEGTIRDAVGKSSRSIFDLLVQLGIPHKYAQYMTDKIMDDIVWKYGKNATVEDVEVINARYRKTTITYSAEVYIPGTVDYMPILVAYTCSGKTCTLNVRIVPT